MKKELDLLYQKLDDRHLRAEEGGGLDRITAQHQKGKYTARERIEKLLDRNSFVELDKFVVHQCHAFEMEQHKILGDGVVTGHGLIHGRPVYLYAQDFTIFGGTLSWKCAQKIGKVMDLALKSGVPVIGINDSGGARIQEGVESLDGYGLIFLKNTLASGVIPQISVILGPCAGGAVYSPGITDFIFMVKEISHMFVTGPDVIKTVTHEQVTKEQLGGALTHTSLSGVAHFAEDTEEECFFSIRELLRYLPQNNLEDPPLTIPKDRPNRSTPEIKKLIPLDPQKSYNMLELILCVLDEHEFFEVQKNFAQNLLIGFGRLNGRVVGVVANQPDFLAGCLDINAAVKGARFIRFCDAFNIPLITFVDVPGFLPGTSQEFGGIIKHGAKLIYAYAEATVPKITLIVRKAFGGGYIVMSSKYLCGDINLAYPMAQIAVMGLEGAINVLFKRDLLKSDHPDQLREELKQKYEVEFNTPYHATETGSVDAIIKVEETRKVLIQSLEVLKNKADTLPSKKHGNIPL